MAEIAHRVELADKSFANTLGPQEVIAEMYPMWHADGTRVYVQDETIDVVGVTIKPFNSALNVEPAGVGLLAIKGNTKTGTCAVAEDCGSCALAGSGLSIVEMSEKNCAQANTAVVFESMGVDPDVRFMLFPVGQKLDAVVVSADYKTEKNGDVVMQHRLPASESAVFTESWAKQNGIESFAIAMNGADGSFGIASTEIAGEKIAIAFCSMRPNMGDRGPDFQILRKGLNAYFNSRGIAEEDRQGYLSKMQMSITIGASAALANFAHKIQIPELGSKKDLEIREGRPDLIAEAGGEITPRTVLDYEFAGALGRGSIYRQSDAWLGVQTDQYSVSSCPLNGETCNVDYRFETRYALLNQLRQMGVPSENVIYDDSRAMDPSSPDNNMASNRRENNEGVATPMTNRTINGMVVKF